jgi:tRNA pseudouridine55 synthase
MNGGILIVNKPKDCTSRDIVDKVGNILGTTKVGHCGTLDPIATGVLVLGIDDGLKVLEFMNNDTKEYVATARLGMITDTLDVTGNIEGVVNEYWIKEEKLKEVLNSFKKKYMQEVPFYSSVKVNGVRLYKYAREGKKVELPKREVEIYDIELIDLDTVRDTFKFRCTVSKGTYIRSLIRDIGKELCIPCVMEDLERTRQGLFSIEDAYSLEDIESNNFKYIPISKVLDGYYTVTVDSFIESKIKDGRVLENRYNKDIVVFKNSNGDVIGIYEPYYKDKSKIKPIKVFK